MTVLTGEKTTLASSRSSPGRIAIITGFSLALNPRPLKEAAALRAAGHEVLVLGASLDQTRLATDEALACRHGFKFQSVVPLAASGRPPLWRSLAWRTRNRLAGKAHRLAGIESRHQLGHFTGQLLRATRSWRPDYSIVHLEQGLWVGAKLLEAGQRIGVDMEDWYSEDLLPEARRHRPLSLLRSLETRLLQSGTHRSCPSHAMSRALAAEFSCPRPAVVYNTFPWSDREQIDGRRADRRDGRRASLHWVSQTIGPGRGLEDLFRALPAITGELEIHLRGRLGPADSGWLRNQIPEAWRSRVFVHPLVSNAELLSRIAEHDIGFAGEMKYCRSRDLTATNKLFQYLLAGLAVVASDTSGQREIAAACPAAISLFPSGDAAALGSAITHLLASPVNLANARATALRAARETYCWERSSADLLRALEPVFPGAGQPGTPTGL